MLDAGRTESSGYDNPFEGADEPTSRKQYTLKGVEEQAIQLMRDAARVEGMKIGSWVSLRMREAAERALGRSRGQNFAREANAEDINAKIGVVSMALHQSDQQVGNDRLTKIERDLDIIVRNQAAIMAKLLSMP